ncbi:MAG: hypothetical protein R3F55_20745 [Alphaproteobacteria bacterium]
MKALRIVLIVVVGVVAVIAGLVYLVFGLTDEAAEATDALFARFAAGEAVAAYEATAPDLQGVQSADAFAEAVAALGLDRFDRAEWTSREISTEGTAQLGGTVTRTDGSTIALDVALTEVGDEWRVARFTSPDMPGVGGGLPDLPDLEGLETLTRAALAGFADAVARADFTAFHAEIAALWQRQIDADQLKEAFQSVIDAQVDLTGIEGWRLTFEPAPTRDADGVLEAYGGATGPRGTLYFRLRFFFERPDWKLIGIEVGDSPLTD